MKQLNYLKRLASLAGIILLFGVAAIAFQAPASTVGSAKVDSAPRVVRRTVLENGKIQFEYADGTMRIVPSKSAVPSSPADPQESSGTTAAGTTPDETIPVAPPSWLKDPETNRRFLKAMGDYYDYRSSGLQHRSRVFAWQLFSSKIIFVIVLLLVGAGIVFAALQFRAGLAGVTEIDLSPTSIKVSSPVLGVIILVISLAFFYLYLVYVYPISELV